MKRRHTVAAAVVVMAAAVLATASPIAADDDEGRIAFASDRSGNDEIYVMSADGSDPMNLTNHPASDTFPNWSPDGKRIVFVRGSGFGRELYVMNANGTNQTRLTFNTVADVQPVWSPNGMQLAFVRFGADGNRELYVMQATPNGATTQLTDDPAFDFLPDWAPNGRIAFTSSRGGEDEVAVYTIKSDGSKLRRLSPPELYAGTPGWSPDGGQIAAADNFCGACPESDIVVIDLEDGEIRQLTDTPLNDTDPDFSPDGDRITYNAFPLLESGGFGPADIYIIDADGGDPENLTSSDGFNDRHPDWEPNRDD